MRKHTPGPWTYKRFCVHAQGIRISQSGYVGAASCSAEMAADQERIANARLISAAPDLLAACKEIIAKMDSLGDYPANLIEPETDRVFAEYEFDDMRAAIAKATGK